MPSSPAANITSVPGSGSAGPLRVATKSAGEPFDSTYVSVNGVLLPALSQLLLDQGRQFCFLYTDLSNPTSNKIYQAIGYRSVIDADLYRFGSV